MENDISNQTVFILAVLIIVVSILGVVTVMFETSQSAGNQDFGVGSASGKIKLDIVEGPQSASTQGSIKLNIVNNDI